MADTNEKTHELPRLLTLLDAIMLVVEDLQRGFSAVPRRHVN